MGLIRKLLENDGENAKRIKANFKPTFESVEQYLKHKKSVNIDKQTVVFNQDGTITIDYKNKKGDK
jgi:hypothetical protein